MHELAIAQDVVRAVLAEATRRNAIRVKAVDLDIGALEGLREIDLRRAFSIESAGTVLNGAILRVRLIPAHALCPRCGTSSEIKPPSERTHPIPDLTCPKCRADRVIDGGRGFVIRKATLVLDGGHSA